MLNPESRKYFTRAFCISGVITFWKLRHENHIREIQECLQTNKTGHELVEYLKTVNFTTLAKCHDVLWVPSIESPNAIRPFMTQTPEEIHNAGKTPIMDAMFSIVSQVPIRSGLIPIRNSASIWHYMLSKSFFTGCHTAASRSTKYNGYLAIGKIGARPKKASIQRYQPGLASKGKFQFFYPL